MDWDPRSASKRDPLVLRFELEGHSPGCFGASEGLDRRGDRAWSSRLLILLATVKEIEPFDQFI